MILFQPLISGGCFSFGAFFFPVIPFGVWRSKKTAPTEAKGFLGVNKKHLQTQAIRRMLEDLVLMKEIPNNHRLDV